MGKKISNSKINPSETEFLMPISKGGTGSTNGGSGLRTTLGAILNTHINAPNGVAGLEADGNCQR